MSKKYKKNSRVILSEHFTSNEFDCKCSSEECLYTYISKKLIKMLEKLRVSTGLPLVINSGYRCREHNIGVGGSKRSQHCLGLAADVRTPIGLTDEEFLVLAENVGFAGLGLYKGRIHVDVREGAVVKWNKK